MRWRISGIPIGTLLEQAGRVPASKVIYQDEQDRMDWCLPWMTITHTIEGQIHGRMKPTARAGLNDWVREGVAWQ